MDIDTLLREHFVGLRAEKNFSFSAHTTIGCGGFASVCVCPSGEEEAQELLRFLEKCGIPYCFLGVGANTLAADGLFEGVVIRFVRMKKIAVEGGELAVGAGVTGGALLRFSEENGVGGLEFLTGIPTSVGGAAVMNAGVREGHMGDAICTVRGIERGKLRTFSLRECEFSEKSSIFQSGIAVTEVRLRAERASREVIAARKAALRERRKHLPRGRSMGCVFVNPAGQSAGALLASCGLKSARVGGAVVSAEHANFIINEGATSSDVAALIEYMRKTVLQKTGILLREEIRRIPGSVR